MVFSLLEASHAEEEEMVSGTPLWVCREPLAGVSRYLREIQVAASSVSDSACGLCKIPLMFSVRFSKQKCNSVSFFDSFIDLSCCHEIARSATVGVSVGCELQMP